MIQKGNVSINIENNIGTITFFHPKSNSLPATVLGALANTITKASNNPDIKVIILKSEGKKAFCAGASFDELLSIQDFPSGKEFFMGFARIINAIRKCPQFIIARVQGKAVGGGVGLAAVADYTLALKSASVKLSELAVGIGPFVVGPAVEKKVGSSAFASLAINATEWQTAEWAKEKGLYVDTFETILELDEAINILASKLAKSNPKAMALIKKAIWIGTDHWDKLLEERAEMSGKLVLSKFTSNAINKFKKGVR